MRAAEPTLMDGLARLAVLEPDGVRAGRTRQQCRAVLGRQRAAHARKAQQRVGNGDVDGMRSRVRPAAIAAFGLLCAMYVGELVATAARLLGR